MPIGRGGVGDPCGPEKHPKINKNRRHFSTRFRTSFWSQKGPQMSSFCSLLGLQNQCKNRCRFRALKSRLRDPPGHHPGPSDPQNVCFSSRKTTHSEKRRFRSEWPPGSKKCPKRPPNGSQMEPKMIKNASKNEVEKTMKKCCKNCAKMTSKWSPKASQKSTKNRPKSTPGLRRRLSELQGLILEVQGLILDLQGLILDAPGSVFDLNMLIFGPLGGNPQHFSFFFVFAIPLFWRAC